MPGEPFCDFGGLPVSQCGHCREQRYALLGLNEHGLYRRPDLDALPWQHPLVRDPPRPRPLTEAETARYLLARYGRFPAGTGPFVTNGGPFTPSWFAALWERHEAAAERGDVQMITARWRGRCPGCGEEWDEGDEIGWSGDESAWVCGECCRRGVG